MKLAHVAGVLVASRGEEYVVAIVDPDPGFYLFDDVYDPRSEIKISVTRNKAKKSEKFLFQPHRW